MKKDRVTGFFKEIIYYIIIAAILQLIVHMLGWTDSPTIVNIICMTIGWIAWRFVMLLISKNTDK